MAYTIEEHQHRLAFWAASRGAMRVRANLDVYAGKALLEACGFLPNFSNPSLLPAPQDIDQIHQGWRDTIKMEALNHHIPSFTDGIAAKLINCYLKVRFVCAGHHLDIRVRSLHPPIDSLMFKKMAKANIGGEASAWRHFNRVGWSNFDATQYQAIINLVRSSLNHGEPLWKAEEFWPGYR